MLSTAGASVAAERSSKKAPLTDAEVADLLSSVRTVKIAKGKAVLTKPAAETSLEDLRGPTGNVRAPLLRAGTTLLVGFHEEALRSLL